ncbi:MAG: Crp/Fnr family transcriptional regulator [Chitinophagaceae bacterium]|nr:Crp/Fnr family transcriptional regulator [Chitinophagaceae bacterium]
MEPLFLFLNTIAPMSPELEAHLRAILQHILFKKGEYILKKGRVNQNIYFIESGFVRIFYELADREVTLWFLAEQDIFISVKSFFRQLPSKVDIVALEDCICWYITHGQLEDTCRKFPEFNTHRIWITEEYYCRSEDRHEDMQSKTAEERYTQFAEQRPDLLQRVPLNLLPSYLDVAPSTFHKIRNEYANRRR